MMLFYSWQLTHKIYVSYSTVRKQKSLHLNYFTVQIPKRLYLSVFAIVRQLKLTHLSPTFAEPLKSAVSKQHSKNVWGFETILFLIYPQTKE